MSYLVFCHRCKVGVGTKTYPAAYKLTDEHQKKERHTAKIYEETVAQLPTIKERER